MSQQSDKTEGDAPPPIRPENVLDSVFSEGGPMPTAKFSLRALALILDFILMTAVASIIIWKIVLPQSHPGASGELKEWSQEYAKWYATESGYPEVDLKPLEVGLFITTTSFASYIPPEGPQGSKDLDQALALSNEIRLLIFWLYFAIGEAFFAGSSLGKRICRIRSVSTITLGPPPILSGFVRGGLKTVTLFWLFPIAFIATFISLFFNKRRQLGHDLCARTTVVDEKYVNLRVRQ